MKKLVKILKEVLQDPNDEPLSKDEIARRMYLWVNWNLER